MAEGFDFLKEIGSIDAPRWCDLWFLRDGSYGGGGAVRFRSEDAATAMGISWLMLASTVCVLMPDGSDVPGRSSRTSFRSRWTRRRPSRDWQAIYAKKRPTWPRCCRRHVVPTIDLRLMPDVRNEVVADHDA
jgi:hypothetical protein